MTTTLQSRVLLMIARAAEKAAPCPTNAEIAGETGLGDDRSGSEIFLALERRGLIVVERTARGRRAFVPSTASWTGWRFGHGDQRDYREIDGGFRGPPPEHLRVDRDPCPRCNVRGDIGCAHSGARLGIRMGL